jgi:zinc-ribbon domain
MAAPTPATAAATMTCPKCGAAVPVGNRFCNACGAAMTSPSASTAPSTAPATSAPGTSVPSTAATGTPVDLRERVDQDRGVLKRLQLLVPGYRGYRQATDIQEADSLLRVQVADKIKNARATLENTRQALVQASQFGSLNDLAPLIADLMRLEGEIRHAEQGYTGISPAVRIQPQQLDRLYEYDFGFAHAGDQLAQTIAPLPGLASGPNSSQVGGVIATARGQVNQLDQAFKARIQAIEGIRVS